jgi:hypothetical protein
VRDKVLSSGCYMKKRVFAGSSGRGERAAVHCLGVSRVFCALSADEQSNGFLHRNSGSTGDEANSPIPDTSDPRLPTFPAIASLR